MPHRGSGQPGTPSWAAPSSHSSPSTATFHRALNGLDPNNFPTALTANGFSKTGYVFSAWTTTPSGGSSYANGASVSLPASITLYAQWYGSHRHSRERPPVAASA